MKKIFLYLFIFISLFFISFLSYFSFYGIKTKNFNNVIENTINKTYKNLTLEIDYIQLYLNLKKLNIEAKTLSPKIIFHNTDIEIESIKSLISIKAFLTKEFALKNLNISTKSTKITKIIKLIRNINNSPQLYILQNKILDGYLAADLKINFDENGKVKEDYEFNGYVKDGKIDLLSGYNLNKVNFLFSFKNKKYDLRDIKFSLNELNFYSSKVYLENNDEIFFVEGSLQNDNLEINNKKISSIKNLHPQVYKVESINFSSDNNFSFKIDNKFKISELFLKTKIILENLSFRNEKKGKYFFPEINNEIYLKDHKIDITLKDDIYSIKGSGNLLLQEEIDQIRYNINYKNELIQFKSNIQLSQNQFFIDFLNYKKDKNSSAFLKTEVVINLNKEINFKSIEIKENRNVFMFEDILIDKDFKIIEINNINLDYIDAENKKNIIKLSRNDNLYNIIGPTFNANNLISKLLESDDNKKDLFKNNFNLNFNIDKVFIDEISSLKNLNGSLRIIDNKVNDANINSFFLNDKKFIFSIKSKNDEIVTTLFSEKAEPLVKRYKFIKGFEEGTLDFYSKKKNNKSISRLNIFDFKLQELPALTKLLTLASLQGIADTLTGEGIRFNELEMNFSNDGNNMIIDELYAIGPAISILMDGYIEKDKLVSLRGTLVPATTLNKTIGSIPLLGKILVGSKVGEGVFGVSFKIKGHPDSLDTKVNPIKTLTPRFITRTLEKIKN